MTFSGVFSGVSDAFTSFLRGGVSRFDRPDEREFLPAALEILETPPSPAGRALALIIGERGASLSGGQRQRMAIARALVGNPRILIFDEATSALDYESEAAIQANMRRITHSRTVIVIAHRLSTLRGADRIVTIEQGRLIEDGSHTSLLAAGGRYAELWRLQAGDAAPAGQNFTSGNYG